MQQYRDNSIKVVQHASRTLTKTEQGYGQIEKEGLALVYAVTKFHRMIWGREFELQTDHEPLLNIFGSKKGIPVHTANRLQRWSTTLLGYNFKIRYISTDKFGCVDVLSRLISNQCRPEEDFVIASIQLESEMNYVVDESLRNMPLDSKTLEEAVSKDKTLQLITKFVRNGWPNKIETKGNLKSNNFIDYSVVNLFSRRRESLSVVNGLLLYGNRVVIPSVFHQKILRQLHFGHPGIPKMKALARNFVYWPKLDDDIVEYCRRCSPCAKAAKLPVKVPLQSWPEPEKVWDRIHVDYAGPVDGYYYFVIVDALSKYPEIFKTTSITTNATIGFLSDCFTRYGFVSTIVSDNGTQFTSKRFELFCKQRGIKHITTAPFTPMSNGQAERFVGTLKMSFEKLKGEEVDNVLLDSALETFLFCYRSTPNVNCPDNKSPAEVFLGRKMKIHLDLLFPTVESNRPLTAKMMKQNEQFDRRNGVVQKQFNSGDLVFAHVHQANKAFWVPGKIISRIGSVMYAVQLTDPKWTKKARYHANQLRKRYGDDDQQQPTISTPLDILISDFHMADDLQLPPEPADDHDHIQFDDQIQPSSSDPVVLPRLTTEVPANRDMPAPSTNSSTVPDVRRSSRLQHGPILPSRFNNYVLY